MTLDQDEAKFVGLMLEQFFSMRQVGSAQEALGTTAKDNDWLDDVAGELWAGLERRGFVDHPEGE